MTKKILAAVLVGVLALGATACGGGGEEGGTSGTSSEATTS